MENECVRIGVKVTDTEIVEKLEILRLERGISSNSFIINAIAEKLRKDGYLQSGKVEHMRKPMRKPSHTGSYDMEWIMRNRK